MEALFNKNLLSTKKASELSGYTSDYIARLARSGKISAQRVGHTWFVDLDSLQQFLEQQESRKIEYARALAQARQIEYQTVSSRVSQVNDSPVKPVQVPQKSGSMTSFQRHAFALSVAFLVVLSGAFVANATTLPNSIGRAVAAASEIALGFNDTFGNIPSLIATKVEMANAYVRANEQLVANHTSLASSNFAVSIPTINPSVVAMETGAQDFAPQLPFTPNFAQAPSAPASTSGIHAPLINAYALITNPRYAVTTVRNALIESPRLIFKTDLAFGAAFVNAVHSVIGADVGLTYTEVNAAPQIAHATVAFIGGIGTVLEFNTAHMPALAYNGAIHSVQLAGVSFTLPVKTPAVPEVTHSPSYAANVGNTASGTQYGSVSMLAAVAPTLSTGQQIALTTYETISGLWHSTQRNLALFWSPPPTPSIIVLPPTAPYVQPITQPVIQTTESTTTQITNTGISDYFLNTSLASLRANILATVAQMIQPASGPVKIVNNYTYTGIDNGRTVIETAAPSDDVTDSTDDTLDYLAVTNSISSGGSVSAPYFIGTSAVTTSSFAGNISVGGMASTSALTTNALMLTNLTGGSTRCLQVGPDGTVSATVGGCGSGSGNGTGNVATSSSETAGDLPYWTTTAGTPAELGDVATSSLVAGSGVTFSGTPGYLVGGTAFTINTPWTISGNDIFNNTGTNVGIGTSSPWANLSVASVNASTLAPLFAVASSSANSVATSTLFVVNGNGNVGIGTNNPAYPLQISQLDAGTNNLLTLSVTGTGATGDTNNILLQLPGSGGTTRTYAEITAIDDTSTLGTGDLTFSTAPSVGTLTEKMRITAAGNVGIGTTSPGSLLSIGNTNGINFTTATTTFSSAGGINLAAGCYALNGICLTSSGGGTNYWTSSGSTLYNNTGTYVGIGTTNPTAALSVEPTSGVTPFTVENSSGSNLFSLSSYGAAVFGAATNSNIFINGGGSTPTASGLNDVAIGNQSLSYYTTSALNNLAFGYRALYGSSTALMTGADNFAAGNSALLDNTTGSQNNAIGNGALESNTTGKNNNALGDGALFFNTTGVGNQAFGADALEDNTTGKGNIAIGGDALQNNTTGQYNEALGFEALNLNTTGNYNDAFGIQTLQDNTTGIENNAFGLNSLFTNATGSINNAFGPNALYSNSGGSNNNALGGDALYSNTYGNYNNAFGAQALYSNTSGTSNNALGISALYSNTSGTGNNALGSQALQFNTTGNYNNAIGAQALQDNTTGIQNDALGLNALFNNLSGNYNNAIGPQALYSNTTGSNNNALGAEALQFNTTGNYNNAMGSQALQDNTTGIENNAFGLNALFSNASGTTNNALGPDALYSNTVGMGNNALGGSALFNNASGTNNNALGPDALYNNTIGMDNNAFGPSSLYNNATGTDNNALGLNTLGDDTSGSFNNALGYKALLLTPTGNYDSGIGYQAGYNIMGGYDDIDIGDTQNTGGHNISNGYNDIGIGYNSGIGTSTNSTNFLNIGNSFFGTMIATTTSTSLPTSFANVSFGIATSSLTGSTFSVQNSATTNNVASFFSNGGSPLLTIQDSGNVGIGTTSPGSLLSLGTTNGINFTTSTTTFGGTGGVNLTNGGCYAVYGICLTSGSGTNYWTYNGSSLYNNTGTNVGIGSSTPWATLSDESLNAPATSALFAVASSSTNVATTSTLFVVNGNGNVGIGTNIPAYPLQISQANSGVNTMLTLSVIGTGATGDSNNILFQLPGGGGTTRAYGEISAIDTLSSGGTGALTFSTSPSTGVLTEKMRITPAGFVGIGTTTPWGTLSVAAANGTTGAPLFDIASSSINVATSTIFNVLGNGNVGIGTTSPGSLLSIGSTNGINFTSATSTFNSTGGGINIASGCYAVGGICLTSSGASSTNYWTSSGSTLYNNTGTSVGIGTTSPYANLSVASADGTTGAPLFDIASSSINVATSTLFVVNGNGTVGIGTTSPTTTFGVVGSGYFTSGLGVGVANTTAGTLQTSGNAIVGSNLLVQALTNCNSASSAVQTNGSGQLTCGTISATGGTSAGGWLWSTPGFVQLATSTDQVGIGSAAASAAKLTINSDSTATTTLALNAVNGQTADILDVYNNSLSLADVISASGNVGVGTTSPGSLLSIGNTNGINFTSATSTFNSTGGGINIASGCYAVNGVCLTGGFSGTVGITQGGTGLTSLSGNQILYTNAAGTALLQTGTSTLSIGGTATNVTGTVAVANGGTGQPSFTSGNLLYGSGSGALSNVATSSLIGGTGITFAGGAGFLVGGSALTINTPWTISGNNIYNNNTANTGIGTTSPYANFSVMAGSTYVALAPSTVFAIGSSTAGTATSTLFDVLSSGNVGIGTNAPTSNLQISQPDAGTNTLLTLSVTGTGTTGDTNNILMQLPGQGGTTRTLAEITAIDASASSGTGNLTFSTAPATGTLTEKMRITPAGFVGIGSTTPYANLSVMAGFNYAALAPYTVFAIGSSTAGTATSTLFDVLSSGNVGIGTTSPGSLLSIGSTNGINFTSATSTFSSTGGGINLASGCYAVNGICLTGAGGTNYWTSSGSTLYNNTGTNVGIGSSTPWANLSVETTNGSTATPVFTVASSSTNVATTSTLFTVSGNGNVGIGTNAPTANLQISQPDAGTNTLLALSVTGDGATGDTNNILLQLPGGSGTTRTLAEITAIDALQSSGTGDLTFSTAPSVGTLTEKMRITPAGFVGIASTTPWALLSVNPNGIGTSAPSFVIGSSTATNFIVTNGGTVGIGTTSPTTTFGVVGSGYFTSGLGVGVANTTAGTLQTSGNAIVGSNLLVQALTNCNSASSAVQTNGSGQLTCGTISATGGTSAGGWLWSTPGFVQLATSTDQVGIGSAAASAAKLTINSDSTATTTLALNAVNGQTADILDVYNNSLSLADVISASGNVGVGTTSPLSLFSVGTAGNAFRVDNTGTVQEGIWNASTIGVSVGGTGVTSFTPNSLLYSSANGTSLAFAATSTLSIGGNAATANALLSGATINGVNFTGASPITITAASSTLLTDNDTFFGSDIFSTVPTLGSLSGVVGANNGSLYSVSTSTLNIGGTATNVTGTVAVANGGTGQPSFTSGNLLYGAGNGAVQSVSTSSESLSGAFSYSGSLGALVGGTNGTLSLATNGVTLTNLSQIAGNSILGNATGATGNITAISTSTLFGTGTGGQVLAWNNGVPQWVATSSINNGVTSVAGTFPIISSGGNTPTLSFDGLSTSTQEVSGNIPYFSGANTFANVATSSIAVGNGISVTSGTLGAQIGGSNVTLGIANGALTLAQLPTIGANTLLGNATGATGGVTALSTSTLNIGGTAANVTGTVAVANGGTGLSSLSGNQILYTNAAGTAFAQTSTSTLSIGGNANTATQFQNAQTINGVSFNGTAPITITAASSTVLSDNDTFSGSDIFSTVPILGSLAGVVGANNGSLYSVSTSTLNIGGTAANVTGIVAVGNGGTGQTSFTSGNLLYGSGSGALSSVATSSIAVGNGISVTSGTLGAQIGGSNVTFGIGTNALTLLQLPTIGANTILGNGTGATGNVTALATSTLFGTGVGGQVLAWSNGVPQWVASTTLATISGTLGVSQGGTGLSSLTGNQILYTNAAGTAFLQTSTSTLNIGGTATNVTGTVAVANGGTGQPSFTSGNLLYGAGNGAVQSVSTSSESLSGAFSYSGSLGALVGGTNGTLSLATNGVTLTNLSQIAGNSILGNATGATGNITAISTSTLNIGGTAANVTGTVAVGNGGTGQTSFTAGNLLYGAGSGAVQSVATSSVAVGSGISVTSGVLGSQIGGSNVTLGIATNALALSQLPTIGANTILGNATGATGNVTALSTSTLNIGGTAGNVTGVVALTNGGTGLSSLSGNQILYTNPAGTALLQTGTSTLSIGGNANTATQLQNARTINGVSFNGTAPITITAASSTVLSDNDTFSGSDTFSTLPTLGSLSGFVAGNAGSLYQVATSSIFGYTPLSNALASGNFLVGSNSNVAQATSSIFITPVGNVGIGTVNPGAQLEIADNGQNVFPGGWNANLKLSGQYPALWLHDSTDNDGSYIAENQGILYFGREVGGSSSGYSMIMDASGNVSIDSGSAPTYPLDVKGAAHIVSYLDASYLVATTTSATSTFTGGLTIGGSNLVVNNFNSNVGIGTTSPGSLLSIGSTNGINFTSATSTFSSTGGGINIASGCYAVNDICLSLNNLSGTLGVSQGGTGQPSFTSGNLLYGAGSGAVQSVATSSITAGTGVTFAGGTAGYLVGGSNLTINTPWTSSGNTLYNNTGINIGIGTSSPSNTSNTLSVSGNSYISDWLGVGVSATSSDYANDSFSVMNGNYGQFSLIGQQTGSDPGFDIQQGQANGTGSGNAYLVLGAVGTQSSDAEGLNVTQAGLPSGTVLFQTYLTNGYYPIFDVPVGTNNTVFGGKVGIGTSSPSSTFSIGSANAAIKNTPLFTVASSSLNLSTTTLFTVNGGGNIGIGTSSPWANLSVNSLNAAASSALFSVASSSTNVGTTSTLFVVNGNGNVGIGTNAPTSNLQISQQDAGTNTMLALSVTGDGVTGDTNNILFQLPGGAGTTRTYAEITAMDTLGSGGTGALLFSTSPSTSGVTQKMIITPTGNVGIGTSTPWATLSVSSANAVSAANLSPLFAVSSSSLSVATSTLFTIMPNGNVGVGTTSPWARFSLDTTGIATSSSVAEFAVGNYASTSFAVLGNGNVDIDTGSSANSGTTTPLLVGSNLLAGTTVAAFTNTSGTCTINPNTTSLSCSSDSRLKKNINDLTPSLTNIMSLVPVTYNWDTEATGTPTHTGFIAQQVLPIFPDLVSTAPNGYYQLNYGGFAPYLVSSLQQVVGALDITNALTGTSTLKSFYQGTTTPAVTIDATGNVGIGTTTATSNLDVSGDITGSNYSVPDTGNDQSFAFGTSTVTASIPSSVLTATGNVDLYQLATYNLSGIAALAAAVNSQEVQITSLETRVAALESGALASESTLPSLSTTSLISALNSVGVFIKSGIAQFGTLVSDQFVAAANSAGTSSAGTAIILAGNTVAQVNNAYVQSTTKVFVTFNSPITGNWYVSDKENGSFEVVLSVPQTSEVSFDYFLVQTVGQIATTTAAVGDVGPSVTFPNATTTVPTISTPPPVIITSPTPPTITPPTQTPPTSTSTPPTSISTSTPSTPSAPADTTPPVVTLLGNAAMQITVGDTFTDPGATATDSVDGDLTSHITVSGTVDTTTPGVYTLTYSVTDSAGNTGIASRVVTVVAPVAPTPPSTDASSTTP
jgi:hypothetical protein